MYGKKAKCEHKMIQFKLMFRCFNFHFNSFVFCNLNYQSLASIAYWSFFFECNEMNVDPLWWPWSMMRLLNWGERHLCVEIFFTGMIEKKVSSTHIHVGTPCNPFPLRKKQQTSVKSVIQNNLLRDIFLHF